MWRPYYVAQADALRLETIANGSSPPSATGQYALCTDTEAGPRIRARRSSDAARPPEGES